ncbi:hypothetical protein ACIP3B_33625 [Streptomyces anulatus]|uniref:hypothetical protein n=1 Tax=Streptomyces anulatus TaxID=1892 RepID=UPI0033E7F9E5
MPPPSRRTGWLSMPHLLGGSHRGPADAVPVVGPCPAVALYAVAPLRGVEHLVLDDLAAYAQDRGWVVPSVAHIAYRAGDWDRERAWLLEQGLFAIAADPTELLAGLEPGELRA